MSNKKSFRKFAVSTLAASAAVAAVAPVVSAQSVSFTDIQQGDSHYEGVIALAEQGIVSGYQDGTFRPTNPISRQHVAVMLYQALDLNVPANVGEVLSVYTDVDSSHPYADQIAAVTVAGAFTGNAQGEFMPDQNISRQQMASSLRSAFNLDTIPTDGVNVNLSNVAASHRDAVQTIANLGLTNQLSDYRPAESITRGQFATQLNGVLELLLDQPPLVDHGEVESIQAINNTTVEVTFVDSINDIKALDFAIQGLTVENAAVKQTDASTAILTTSPQEGGAEYTVTANEEVLGSFTGISAVIPSAIEIASNSTQAKVGEEVTVRAQVAVEPGQSAEGIPVTFNILAQSGALNTSGAYEVYTDANGVASYSYTQYYGGDDTVVAYPTGAPATRSTEGKVYWGIEDRLVLNEVTEGNTLANGSKKVYEVQVNNADGAPYEGLVNIAFEENVNVTQDDGVTGVVVTDATNGQNEYPYQYTTGGASNFNIVQVRTDENGEATFTLTGANASVTPIVFIDGTWIATGLEPNTANGKLNATELQVAAPTVNYVAVQELEVVVESIGNRDAAAIDVVEGNSGNGGRDYKATIRDTDGELAPAGTTVYVTVQEDELEGNVYLNSVSEENKFEEGKILPLTTNANGEVSFTLIGDEKSYITPTVFHDNGDDRFELDDADAQAKGEIVYFGEAVLKTSVLEVKDADGRNVTSVRSDEPVYFHYHVTDQNGKKNTASSNNHIATFQVKNTGFVNSIYVKDDNGELQEIKARATASIEIEAVNGNAELEITSPHGVSSASVDVSSSQYTLTEGAATVSFTDANAMPVPYTGTVTSLNDEAQLISLDGFNPVSYADANFNVLGSSSVNHVTFENAINDAPTGQAAQINVTQDSTGKYTFDLVGYVDIDEVEVPVDPEEPTVEELETVVTSATELLETEGAAEEAVTALQEAIDAAQEVLDNEEATQEEIDAAVEALEAAVEDFNAALEEDEEPVVEGFEFTTADLAGNSIAVGLGLGTFTVEGTIAEEDIGEVTELVLTFTGGTDNPATEDVDESTIEVTVDVAEDGTFSLSEMLNNNFSAVSAEYEVNGETRTIESTDLTRNGQ